MSHKSVGFGRPPIEHRFKPGQSGNPGGRPKKQRNFNALAILDEPITVKRNGHKCAILPFEARIQGMLIKALKEDRLTAIRYLIEQFEKHDLLAPQQKAVNGVVSLPNTMPWDMTLDMVDRYGMPPWTKAQIKIAAEAYKAERSEEQRLIDDEIGYPHL